MQTPAPPTEGVHHIALLVEDLPQAEHFYSTVLGLPVERRWPGEAGEDRSVWLQLDPRTLLMLERSAPSTRRREGSAGGWHLIALEISPENRQAWKTHLQTQGVLPVEESSFSLYYEDPEGNKVALSHWPREDPADEASS